MAPPKRPEWKAKLKETCLERMRKQRNDILWQARSRKQVVAETISNIVSNELERLGEMIWEHNMAENPMDLSVEEYEQIMLAMQATLYEEETEKMVQDFENAEALQDRSTAELLAQQENGVLCPICKRSYLAETKTSIVCSEGCLKLDIVSHEKDLEFLRVRLAELLQQHFDSGCRSQAIFCFDDQLGLCMQCSSCDCFEMA